MGQFAYLGKDDFGARLQLLLPFQDDQTSLRARLLEIFAGRTLSFDELCDEAYPDPRFYVYVESDFRGALLGLISRGEMIKHSVTTRTIRGLRGRDRLQFPH